MNQLSPYHPGEVAAQEHAGEVHAAARNGRVIAHRIPARAQAFVDHQRFVVLTSVDRHGDPWASVLQGPSGFVVAPTPAALRIELAATAGHPEDPLWANLEQDPRLGMLFVDFATRRRLRVNGRTRLEDGRQLELAVHEAYPNCPKYIQRRHLTPAEPVGTYLAPPPRFGAALDARQRSWIAEADTFFVATVQPEGGADASHRGGAPGFVEIVDERTLRIPDYAGNSMFNTLGNLMVHPRAGLVFVDFGGHRTLQLSGGTEVHWNQNGADPLSATRYWTFEIDRWIESEVPALHRWEFLDYSRFNPVPRSP